MQQKKIVAKLFMRRQFPLSLKLDLIVTCYEKSNKDSIEEYLSLVTDKDVI